MCREPIKLEFDGRQSSPVRVAREAPRPVIPSKICALPLARGVITAPDRDICGSSRQSLNPHVCLLPKWVKIAVFTICRSHPVCPDERTPSKPVGLSQTSQHRKSSTAGVMFRQVSDVDGSVPSPPTTARPRHSRVSNICSPAGRSSSGICSDPPHQRGWHICPGNLRLDPHIAPCLALLLPVS